MSSLGEHGLFADDRLETVQFNAKDGTGYSTIVEFIVSTPDVPLAKEIIENLNSLHIEKIEGSQGGHILTVSKNGKSMTFDTADVSSSLGAAIARDIAELAHPSSPAAQR